MCGYFACLQWLIRSLKTPGGFWGEQKGGNHTQSQQAQSSMGWLLPHGLLCWGLTLETNTRRQQRLLPAWQVVSSRAQGENRTYLWSKKKYTILLFFQSKSTCLVLKLLNNKKQKSISGSFTPGPQGPKGPFKSALTRCRPLDSSLQQWPHRAFLLHRASSAHQACSVPQHSHS